MEGEEYWDVYRTGSPYKYQFQITEHVQDNIYKGESSYIMGEEVENEALTPRKKKLNLIHFQDDNAVLNYENLAQTFNTNDFSPFFKMTSRITQLDKTIFGVGRELGIPLKLWMKTPGRAIWEYFPGDIYKRPGEDWRKIGQLIGTGVYANHINDLYIGNLLNSSYFNEADGKMIFVKDPQNKSLSTVAGIQNDLRDLINFVAWVQQEIPVLNFARNQPLMGDIAIFDDMFPQTYVLPNTLEELKKLSYFLCHIFLYFEDIHRFSFCDAFRRMRTTIPHFVSIVPFTGLNAISQHWESTLPKDFLTCFNFKKRIHQGAYGQIHFHRSCLHHYNDEAQDKLERKELDQELIKILPLAIPKGFSAFFKSTSISQADKIEELKRDINYLEQYKLQT